MDEQIPTFPPPAEFAAQAVAGADLYEEAAKDRLAYWARRAREVLHWEQDFTDVLDWSDAPFAKWFVGGTTNAAYNALDRHVEAGHGDRVAIHFEGEPGDTRTYTYADLAAEVRRAANAFESLGVTKGDRVAVYLPMIPEAVITLLACARIGAIHSVVFGGFAPAELAARIDDAKPVVIVAASCGIEPSRVVEYKPMLDAALDRSSHTPESVIVLQRPQARAAVVLPFHRLDDVSPGGLGLGLAIADQMTAAMGGDLELWDTPGGGLTAVVSLGPR